MKDICFCSRNQSNFIMLCDTKSVSFTSDMRSKSYDVDNFTFPRAFSFQNPTVQHFSLFKKRMTSQIHSIKNVTYSLILFYTLFLTFLQYSISVLTSPRNFYVIFLFSNKFSTKFKSRTYNIHSVPHI